MFFRYKIDDVALPETRRGMARQALTALAGIHRVDPAQVAYLGGPVAFAEDVKRWDRFYQRAADPERLALVPRLRERLLATARFLAHSLETLESHR